MKACEHCGFTPTPSNRQLVKLYAEHFPSVPVFEMIRRGWLGHFEESDQTDLELILERLLLFYEVTSVESLCSIVGWSGSLMDKDVPEKTSRPTKANADPLYPIRCLTPHLIGR